MTDPNSVVVKLTCDCGEKFDIPVGGIELETIAFTCPACGANDSLKADQIEKIMAQHKAAAKEAFKLASDAAKAMVAKANRTFKRR